MFFTQRSFPPRRRILHEMDKSLYFESCLPIEVMARRGGDTLRFGPMKPVELDRPTNRKEPSAAVQLRQDNLAASLFNLAGFQNQLRWGEQGDPPADSRLGAGRVRPLRHDPPQHLYQRARGLEPTLQTRQRDDLLFAGQISGVEGYTESAASGLLAGINAARLALGSDPEVAPRTTALGSLAHYISFSNPVNYQPSNIAFGLLPDLDRPIRKKLERRQAIVQRALADIETFAASVGEAHLTSPSTACSNSSPSPGRSHTTRATRA